MPLLNIRNASASFLKLFNFLMALVFCLATLALIDRLKRSLLFAHSTPSSVFILAPYQQLARPAGFEPATHSLEGCCSIQLNYGRKIIFRTFAPDIYQLVIQHF